MFSIHRLQNIGFDGKRIFKSKVCNLDFIAIFTDHLLNCILWKIAQNYQ